MAIKAAKRRLDYQPPSHLIPTIRLAFELEPEATTVTSVMRVKQNPQATPQSTLRLDGEQLQLHRVEIDGRQVEDFVQDDNSLTLHDVPSECEICIVTTINPARNTSLEGLYVSGGAFCTQCEAEGFRRITYCLDRPDVLSVFTVSISANETAYPALLSNGNMQHKESLENGLHKAVWADPFPKPCYLFALVAGDFDVLNDTYTTRSGRLVQLELYVDKGKKDRGHHALASLKRAMHWDEETFNLEYDLDVYMIVAVDFFNMGAMENKGLNVFNSKYVLADNATATDEDFFNIESVIAHEYFHNWTGNRVTCRDWFQLSLKEGLTVFRDQLFSETYHSPLATRIKQVRVMREHQFAEDAGPMSHPIRPDEVIEMNNFYTVTVYDKGAEVIRMLWTLLGSDGFKRGMALYFERFDGQAVTCDDFVDAMQDANQHDLSLFKRWYSQSGTPQLSMSWSDNNELLVEQDTPETADQSVKYPLTFPLVYTVIDESSNGVTSTTQQKVMDQRSAAIACDSQQIKPTIILNSGFAAPVKVKSEHSPHALGLILNHADNPLDRWDAAQTLFLKAVERIEANPSSSLNDVYDVFLQFLARSDDDVELIAEVMTLPSLESVVASRDTFNIDTLVAAHKHVQAGIAHHCQHALSRMLETLMPQRNYCYEQQEIMRRRCLHAVLQMLAHTRDESVIDTISALFNNADNMTEKLSALRAAQIADLSAFDRLMTEFEQQWQHDPLVLDKWFALHATSERDDILSRVHLLMEHQQFSVRNPNRLRAIIGSFAFYNTARLHAADGSGYRFLSEQLSQIDSVNPQVAARLVTPLLAWKKFDPQRQEMMKLHLVRLLDNANISSDLFEKVSKSLSA
ncbi:aminopeptidase N [Alteromonas oceanisediminis]|uniref:aminopeptidase N n=1 Tax=Alteromonas oceanisediminis TaxID=2836180 RepID=UPI001BD954A2|nr:aminopeptidase N [Alteromonas oceanisediminis]MBT0587121.1 aminopeptidase N [Alteromonas oceanisediminis]